MIYEFRTYRLRSGALTEFLRLFADALPHRERFSRLAAFLVHGNRFAQRGHPHMAL